VLALVPDVRPRCDQGGDGLSVAVAERGGEVELVFRHVSPKIVSLQADLP
jgi:hypothetical protein